LQTSDETDFVVSQPLEIKQVASDKKLQNNCKTTDALQFPAFEWLPETMENSNRTLFEFQIPPLGAPTLQSVSFFVTSGVASAGRGRNREGPSTGERSVQRTI
jgi:hypothetical protein